LFGLQAFGRVPAMLNYTLGAQSLLASCQAAQIRRIYTSERFVVAAKLERLVDKLREIATVVYLEDLREKITPWLKVKAAVASRFAALLYARRHVLPDEPAIVLLSGSRACRKASRYRT
jgi:acyl-[acyl-carrier-protein]-phospholipid O-acyltransferase/long-chain-fatty-acid--[acyl-carrier-protein] ligase